MKPEDKPEFLRTMNGMAAVFGAPLTPEALSVWWNAFNDWTLHDFNAAASGAVKRTTFMPRPADLFALKKSQRLTPAEAWESGGNDPIAARAMAIATQGRYFGHIDYSEHKWIQKRFLEMYEQLVDVEEAREAAGSLLTGPKAPQLDGPYVERNYRGTPRYTADGKQFTPQHQAEMLALMDDVFRNDKTN